ncbi:hypothetical protein FRC11_010420 [Ceratobasidium sp. 423]|nr:hypothetical protein FRC11_010420 [Ceratobasidium sp. 423]
MQYDVEEKNQDGPSDQIVLCIWYLRAKSVEALGFRMALEGALRSFGKEVISDFIPLEEVFEFDVDKEDPPKPPPKKKKRTTSGTTQKRKPKPKPKPQPPLLSFLQRIEIQPNASFLLCVLTEATTADGGGLWWCEEENGDKWHETFELIYDRCMPEAVTPILRGRFKRRTGLQLACGVGIDRVGVADLQRWMFSTELLDEIITPTNFMFHPAQVVGFAANLVVLLYVEGHNLETALPIAWIRDERAREHTGFLFLNSSRVAKSYLWAPTSRPLGYTIPYCDCQLVADSRWRYKKTKPREDDGEPGMWTAFYKYECTGCGSTMQLLFQSPCRLELVEILDTAYIVRPWPAPELALTITTTPGQD